MNELYETAAQLEDADPFLARCGACGMSLPMAGGMPMPMACLKCYPNGPKTEQKATKKPADDDKKKDDDGDDDMDDDDGEEE